MRQRFYGPAIALVAMALLLAPLVGAQDLPAPGDGFTWERVGDRGLNVRSLAFGPDSTLWATAPTGPHRLDTTAGFPGAWMLVHESAIHQAILPLGQGPGGDTLVVTTGATVRRSVDGGLTWAVVHDRGGGGLYEIPAGYPYAGSILTGALEGIAYSDDRGASFTPSVVPSPDGNTAGAEDFVALPPGSPHAGRILAAGRWGVNVSDDGGATFRESALWQVLYYVGLAVDVVERTGGGVGAVLGGRVSGQANARAWASADGGETWLPDGGGHRLLEGPPNDGSLRVVLSLGGPSALVVLRGGTIYRTDDAGETWSAVGRAPEISTSVTVASAVLGPDRRLYVGLVMTGTGSGGWVWRTAETHDPAPVSNEPPPVPGQSLGLEVAPNPSRGTATVALTVPEAGEVEAWSLSEVEVAVYDVLGRRVAMLHAGRLGAGEHALPLETGSLPPGVYVVRVEAGSTVLSRTVTVLR